MDFTQPLDDDLEPTPLPMSYPMPVSTSTTMTAAHHQPEPEHPVVHRVSMIGPTGNVLENLQQLASLSSTPVDRSSTTSPGNLVSDSDTGAVNDEDDDDDFHSAASHDEFQLIPEPTDIIFGRGQPLRDHPGNMRFRGIIKRFTATYRSANKADKTKIIQQIVKAAGANGTRFLVPHNNQDPFEGCRPAKPAEIRGKISHGLRDAIKVEDLLDNEFVQLWADDQANAPPGARAAAAAAAAAGRMPQNAPPRPQNMMGAPPQLPVAPRRSGNFPRLNGAFSRSTGPAIYHVSVRNDGRTDPSGKGAFSRSEEESAYLDFAEKGGAPVPAPFGGSSSGGKSPDDDENIPTARVVATRASLVDFRPFRGYERKILIAVAALIAALIIAVSVSFATRNKSPGVAPTPSPTLMPTTVSSTLDSIYAKGYLTCGVAERKGYSVYDADTGGIGFEIELCRAIGAAIFGREKFGDRMTEPVEYVFLEISDRFVALDNEDIDVLFGDTTHTMQRQVFEPTTGRGFSFSIPYLYSGLKFSGIPKYVECAEAHDATTGECKDLKVCYISGSSTFMDVVESIFPESAIIASPTFDTIQAMFLAGNCNVMSGEEIDMNVPSDYDGNFTVGDKFHSQDPIAIVTRDDDLKFSDFCNWLLQSLITAEELTYSSSTASLSDIPIVDYWGSELSYMFLDAIAVVGDYGTIFDTHFGPYFERSTVNHINIGQSAAFYPIPFGNVVPDVPPSFSGGTLEKIHTRGHLKCGITPGAIFARLDTSTGTWTGLDVAFCEAVSAAIFDGAINVVYTVLSSKARFEALAEGKVDILARVTTITMERDVLEPTSGVGFTFSPPNFHDEFRMGGIPPYHTCADNLDTESEECMDLVVCVNDGTTQSSSLAKLLPSANILACEDTEEEVAKFIAGECNVIAGGYIDLTPSNMEYLGYSGDWEVGDRSFSREPLALVTREDDVVFSNFVYWVVTSVFYADTHNITQATSYLMPEVDLFQPQVGDEVFRNVIGAVGSYSEIWERTATVNGVAPFGRNRLNTEPYGPQIMSRMLWDKPSSQ